ncbi:MAG: cohesin domain-containing protein, partial [Chloroflexota bacterium]|nr:cohesin domain-containing protein [Chloroflexota bacterium]
MRASKTIKTIGLRIWLVLAIVGLMGGLIPPPVHAAIGGSVGMMVDPTPKEVNLGETFTVDIVVTIPDGAVDTAMASIDFDPGKLDVVGITPGSTLGMVFKAEFDNGLGTIDYEAAVGFFDPEPTADFILATVEFEAQGETAGTPLTFIDGPSPRGTDAIFFGGSVLDPESVLNGNVIILAEPQCTLTAIVDPSEAGTVNGGGSYDCGTTVQVEAIPANDCWYFTGWSGNLSGMDNPTTILLDGDKTITAHFGRDSYTLTTNVDPAEGGTVTGGGDYDCGTTVEVEAISANEYWQFTGWSGDLSGMENPTTIYIDGPKTITAGFALDQCLLNTNVTPPDGGSVSGGGSYDCGSTAIIEATPADECWKFLGWGGDFTGPENPASIVLNGSKTVTAYFDKYEYTVTTQAIPAEGGTISGGGVYDCGTVASVTANPAGSLWYFTGWSGDLGGTENPTTLLVNGNKTVNAHFAQHDVGIVIDPATREVSVGQTFTVDIVVTVPAGEEVDTATASIDFDTTKLAVVSIVPGGVLGDVWESTFDNIEGTVDFDAMAGVFDPNATEDFILATVEFEAQAETPGTPLSFAFVHPERQGNRQTAAVLQGSSVLNPEAVAGGTVIINTVPQCVLTTIVSPLEGGAVEGGGMYDCGSTVTVEAIPADECWYFVGWSGDLSGSTNPTSIVLDGDKT